MRLAYIAHPLGSCPDREANRARAARWCAWAARQGVSPVATWIVLSSQWDESEENRALGLACDVAAIERCDELWLVGGRVSPGMAIESAAAVESAVEVVDLTHLGEEPPAAAGFWVVVQSPRQPRPAVARVTRAARDAAAALRVQRGAQSTGAEALDALADELERGGGW